MAMPWSSRARGYGGRGPTSIGGWTPRRPGQPPAGAGGGARASPGAGRRGSWAGCDRRVDLAASGLIARGVGRGEHVGIWSMNVPEWVVTQFAVARVGAVLVNINPAYRLHELEETLSAADVATVIVGSPFKGSNFVAMIEALCPEVAGAPSPAWTAARLPRLKRLIALGDRPGPGWLTWD